MLSQQRLRKEHLIAQQEIKRFREAVLDALRRNDPSSRGTPAEEALASQRLNRLLWDLLPDESYSHLFSSPEDLVARGSWCLDGFGNPAVTLHLGWGIHSFATTLDAAWSAWPVFAHLHATESFNCCIYPATLEWYIVRAGCHLYPMRCDMAEKPVFMTPPPSIDSPQKQGRQ